MAGDQGTLDIAPPHQQRLDNFIVGDNAELITELQRQSAGFKGLWLCGVASVGKTHLLRGTCLAASERGEAVTYIGVRDLGGAPDVLREQLTLASEYGDLVAIDDAHRLTDAADTLLLMAIYERLRAQQGCLLVSHQEPANSFSTGLPDLDSRLRSLQHFALHGLHDEQKSLLLQQRAKARGYELSPAVVAYWMVRGPRDLGALLTDLERLDRASLSRHQAVTIPLLKQVLGY